MRALDDVLHQFDANEVHTISLPCSPEWAVALALSAPAAPDRFVATLFRLRGLPSATTIGALFDRMGFSSLVRTPTETRVQAVDDRARRAFRRYWLVVGSFSGLIRRRWLLAVETATETGA